MLLSIDPGSSESALCFYPEPFRAQKIANDEVLKFLDHHPDCKLAIEMIASYGMGVGKEVFDTCVWIGRFIERHKGPYRLVFRREVKLHICYSPKANDSTIRHALVDRFGDKGTKKNQGALYGFKADLYAALAVAITAEETEGEWR